MTDQVTTTVPATGRSARSPRSRGGRKTVTAFLFLLPALILLGALIGYPVLYTAWRSLYDATGDGFLGLGNYVKMFTDPATFQSIRNNVVWVIVAPVTCTILGLIFAVLMNRIKWATAFKLIIFMPMAISMVAAGVIFRTAFQENPNLGAANAVIVGIHDLFDGGSEYPGARPRQDAGIELKDDAIVGSGAVKPGGTQDFPLVGVKADSIPSTAETAKAAADAGGGEVTGTVWLDFVRGGGGEPGQLGDGKKGLPDVTVNAIDSSGAVVSTAKTAADGTYVLSDLKSGSYTIGLPSSNFTESFTGISWLGPGLVTGVIILAYIWIWAGFAMVMISSGLSALDPSLQEAARLDGANEWQVFRRITAPLLAPVLVVVFITLIINVLKIFDLVYVIPPGSSLPSASVIAVQMWTVSFGGGNDQGLGSALAILLLILVLPFMIINVRRFRRERER